LLESTQRLCCCALILAWPWRPETNREGEDDEEVVRVAVAKYWQQRMNGIWNPYLMMMDSPAGEDLANQGMNEAALVVVGGGRRSDESCAALKRNRRVLINFHHLRFYTVRTANCNAEHLLVGVVCVRSDEKGWICARLARNTRIVTRQ
jgi:hypothetical protein